MLTINRSVTTLGLTNNKLRDCTALAIIESLKTNKRICKILLGDNTIELKYIRAIEKTLGVNRGLAKQSTLPLYQRQLDQIRVNPDEYNVTQRKLIELNYACQAERAVTMMHAEALKKTQQKQTTLSTKVSDRKAHVDEDLRKVQRKVIIAEEYTQVERKQNEKDVVQITKKISEATRVIEKLGNDGTFPARERWDSERDEGQDKRDDHTIQGADRPAAGKACQRAHQMVPYTFAKG